MCWVGGENEGISTFHWLISLGKFVFSLYRKSKYYKNSDPSFLCVNVTFPIRGPAKLNFAKKLFKFLTFVKYTFK